MAITHQDIADRFHGMDAEARRVVAKQVKERESLQEMCAGIGHVWGGRQWVTTFTHGVDGALSTRTYWRCVCDVCSHAKEVD
jgi:hypothetical protein